MSDQAQTQSGNTSGEADPSPGASGDLPEGTSPTDGQGSDPSLQTPQGTGVEIEVVPGEGATDYTNPLLKGKSPAEIDRIFAAQQGAISEMNSELNTSHANLQTARAEAASQASAPAPVGEDKVYGDDFMSPRFEALESRMMGALEKMVEPLNAANKAQVTGSVRERLREKFQHFGTLEPHIDKMFRDQGVSPETVTESQLAMMYHTAVGVAHEQGINLGEASAPAPAPAAPAGDQPPVNIPQHRPSGAPLPRETGNGSVRDLSEQEKLLAHEYFGHTKDPEGEYRKYQDMDEGDVVSPGFSGRS